jgi:hypothetical protein
VSYASELTRWGIELEDLLHPASPSLEHGDVKSCWIGVVARPR